MGKNITLFLMFTLFYGIIAEAKSPSSRTFEIHRGVNLSHWLSQDFGWAPKYAAINEDDIRFIDSIGYDHVRIPVDEFELWDDNGNRIEPAFDHLLQCLDWCQKYGLRAIVDMHIIRSHYFNAVIEGGTNSLWTDTAAQNHFINLWKELSTVLHPYPTDMLAYELLNEAVAPSADDWNALFNKALSEIRKLEPERVIVVGSNMWQIVQNVPLLQLPENDKNIIISFHFYSPLVFTHYTASWTPLKDFRGTVHYPGKIISDEDYRKFIDTTTNIAAKQSLQEVEQPFDKERMRAMIKPAVEFAKSKGLKLYCGEFGCLPTVPRADRLAYYADLISVFNEEGIAWANWEYKGEFGLYFFDTKTLKSTTPDVEFIKTLLQ